MTGDATGHDHQPAPGQPVELVGHFYGWWTGDPVPKPESGLPLAIAPSDDVEWVMTVTGLDPAEVWRRFGRGNVPWLALIEDEVVGWGWVATREAGISELGIAITLPPGERYLWDFVTPDLWQGRGVYTALLIDILARDGADRFWIGHDEGNHASARGIEKAGFVKTGTAQRTADDRIVFVPDGPADRSEAAAALLGLPVVES